MATFVVGRAVDDVKRSFEFYKVWLYLALDDIFARYRNTVLGPLWNAAYIIAQALALSLVFGAIFHQSLKVLLPYILSGMVGWALGPATILECAGLLMWFSGTIKTQNFPFLFYAYRVVARAGLMFLHNLVALMLVMGIVGHIPIISLAIVPAVLMVMFLSAPYCLMMGMVCARFRDVQMFVSNFSNVLFFLTPIFWMPSNTHGMRSSAVVVFNPFFYLIDIVREPILNMSVPVQDWLVCGGIAVLGWGLCMISLSAFRARVAFWV